MLPRLAIELIGARASKTPNTDLVPWASSRSAYNSFLPNLIMAKPTTEKIGGELGDVRAAIDIEKLNAYLEAHVSEIAAPVTVKQFKVCS